MGNPEDFLPAILEQSPASASGYLTLADYYAGAGDTQRAIADYDHTLELLPTVRMCTTVSRSLTTSRGIAEPRWHSGSRLLPCSRSSSTARTSPKVSGGILAALAINCGHAICSSSLKPDADAIVRTYLRHNGNYRSNAVLRPAYAAQGDPVAATAWLLDVSSAAHDPTRILGGCRRCLLDSACPARPDLSAHSRVERHRSSQIEWP